MFVSGRKLPFEPFEMPLRLRYATASFAQWSFMSLKAGVVLDVPAFTPARLRLPLASPATTLTRCCAPSAAGSVMLSAPLDWL